MHWLKWQIVEPDLQCDVQQLFCQVTILTVWPQLQHPAACLQDRALHFYFQFELIACSGGKNNLHLRGVIALKNRKIEPSPFFAFLF